MLYHCQYCGKPFEAAPAAKRKFCSRECWRKSLIKKVERTCQTCGKTFLAPRYKVEHGKGKYCSRECADTGWEEPCANCGKPVHRKPNHAERFDHVFCSRECYGEFCRDRVTKTCPQCGKEFTDKRSKMGDDRVYCSQECYDLARAADDSIYDNTEFTYGLKERIRKRDNRRCQLCGVHTAETERRLDVHHIDYDKANCSPSNLIALCDSCHRKTNFNRDHWQSILQVKVQG